MELLIARNPDPDSRLPYLLLLPLAGGMVFRTSGPGRVPAPCTAIRFRRMSGPATPTLSTVRASGRVSGRARPSTWSCLDNNAAERAIRLPVVTRRNAGGSRNEDSARLAATAWTVTATAQMAGLNVLTYLTAYFDACGRNGRNPPPGPGLERFLPWKASPEDLQAWAQPARPG